jgi:hypothetical protein
LDDETPDLSERSFAMSTRVTPDVFELGRVDPSCSHLEDHEAYRAALEFLLKYSDGSWPGFTRLHDHDGSLRGLQAPMRCGCTFLALAVW